ncbi:MAG: hypothetical protein HY865_21490 [Chloroflexi bacterium]|nr:hypothetical protein [Chloroflexota bacterium]
MPNEIIKSDSNQVPSFEEFQKMILQHGADSDLINWAAKQYGRIPSVIRALNNFDPSGISSAIDQLFSEKASEREQENILRAVYILANRIWKIETKNVVRLTEEKFKFLYFVYQNSKTDVFSRVDADPIQNLMGISQNKIVSIGQHLAENGFVKFRSWVEGIWILHDGVVKVESELLNNELPHFASNGELSAIEGRIRLRFTLLQHLYNLTGEDTFKKIGHVDLANISKVDHQIVLNQLLPYLESEGWVRSATVDTVKITEDGIDFVKGLQNKKE